MISIDLEELEDPGEEIRRSPTEVASASLLILGGALIDIGSYEPWTRGGMYGSSLVVYRNSLQLGQNDRFSVAGVITLILGSIVMIIGATRLAQRTRRHVHDAYLALFGLVGGGFGLYGVGEARWYAHQMTAAYPKLFYAGASEGVWLVLSGGVMVLVTAVVSGELVQRRWLRGAAAFVICGAACTAGVLLSPP